MTPLDWSGGGVGSGSFSDFYSRYYGSGKKLNSICKYIDEQLDDEEQARYQDIRAISRLLQMHEAWTIFTNFGAMVFNQAFQIRQGITFPAYDVYTKESGLYKALDDSVKMCIAQLSSPMREDAVALGSHDGFYGFTYQTKETGGATWTVNSPEKQRERWLKFATTLRLKMAVSMRNVDPEFYQTVLREVRQLINDTPNALMSEVQDGCQFVLPDSWYDKNENNQLSFWYGMPLAYINSMKISDDPRLPLVANMNYCDTSLNAWYKFVATYYPDSLEMKWVYDKETQTWEQKSWGDVLKRGNVFQGQTANPANSGETFGPGTLLKGMSVTITVHHPEWQNPNEPNISADEKAAREAHNAGLTSARMLNHFTGQIETTEYDGDPTVWEGSNGELSSSFRIASGLQSRHYVMNTGGGGWTGPSWDYDNNTPSENIADPIPVPTVSINTTFLQPLPAPNLTSAMPAASASLITQASQPQAFFISFPKFFPINALPPIFAAVSIFCERMTPGNPQPMRPDHLNSDTNFSITDKMLLRFLAESLRYCAIKLHSSAFSAYSCVFSILRRIVLCPIK